MIGRLRAEPGKGFFVCLTLPFAHIIPHTASILLIFYSHVVYTGSQSAGWFPSPKGGGAMSTYEEMSIILGVAMLIVTILIYVNGNNGTKK